MLILIFGWAVLPTFRRYMMPSSSGSTLNVSIVIYIHTVGQPKNIININLGGPFIITFLSCY
jgi:peptidoglycan biosynthesis protein MviN/MurJ (putative lipid II flippase)